MLLHNHHERLPFISVSTATFTQETKVYRFSASILLSQGTGSTTLRERLQIHGPVNGRNFRPRVSASSSCSMAVAMLKSKQETRRRLEDPMPHPRQPPGRRKVSLPAPWF